MQDTQALLVLEEVHAIAPDARIPVARDVLRRAVLAQVGNASQHERVLWPALIAGRWSLADVFRGSETRYVVAYKNSVGRTRPYALRERERAVLELALAGHSGKWIAFELRISESTVARALRAALRRIGVADTTALIGLQRARFEPLEGLATGVELAIARLSPATTATAALSDAERSVITDISRGKRVATIARERGTSPRTVSNQIASTYRKLGVSSRREALVLLT